jgi:hypothetical protein
MCDNAARQDAIDRANEWFDTVAAVAEQITGSVSALALPLEFTSAATPMAWPLARGMTAIDGLIAEGSFAHPGVRFDDATEADALRALRQAALAALPTAGFIVVEDGATGDRYQLLVRDELAPAVETSFTDLLQSARPPSP